MDLPHGSPTSGSEPEIAVRAGGAIAWRRLDGDVQVLLVHRPKYDDWSFPKGKLRAGEPSLGAAYREVAEETGLRPTVGPKLPVSRYETRQGLKLVEYWAMHADRPGAPLNSDEVDSCEWLSLGGAQQRLSYQRDRELLDALLPTISGIGAPLLVVRHASAGDPTTWLGDDNVRPIDQLGRRQAEALRGALAAFSPARLLSADRARCVQTLEPLAAALGILIEEDSSFNEDEYLASPERGTERFIELAGSATATVVCSQGSVIRHFVDALRGADEGERAAVAEKGSLWALFFGGTKLVAADYYSTFLGWQEEGQG